MWRDGSTAQTELTEKSNNMRQRKGHSAMFGHSAFAAESARCFLSGLTANPERFLPMNIRAPRMLKDGRGSSKPGRGRWRCVLPALLTLPASWLSRNIETYSYHPAVFYSPWNALTFAGGPAPPHSLPHASHHSLPPFPHG